MRKVMTLRALSAALGALALSSGSAIAQDQRSEAHPPATAYASAGTIVDVASANAEFSTLVAAIKAAGLVNALTGSGPFTVFAPTNDAFGALPNGTVDNLLKPENRTALTRLLTYHVVAGKLSAADLVTQIKAGGGSTVLKTASGGTLIARLDGDAVVLTDARGGKATVAMADVPAQNGIIHAIDAVVMP